MKIWTKFGVGLMLIAIMFLMISIARALAVDAFILVIACFAFYIGYVIFISKD